MMVNLTQIQQQLAAQSAQPPLHLWQPDYSGEIDIKISRSGDWFHEGERIERASLVKLFASILRREEDGHYYLLTPVEKWRIKVEECALIVTDVEVVNSVDGVQQLWFTTNAENQYLISKELPLVVETAQTATGLEILPRIMLPNCLSAKLTRSVYYRLVDIAAVRDGQLQVESEGSEFILGSCD